MEQTKYDVFISYKRKSLPTANNLYYRLTTRGYSTFFDLEEMGRDNFNVQLLNYIEKSKDVFVILEEGSLDACKKEDWETDWFCHEIAYALEKKKNIIPILVGGYQMPPQEFFPDKLKELSMKNAPVFNFSFFEAYLDKLIEKKYLLSQPNLQEKATSVFKFYSNENCQVFKEGKLVCSLEGMSDEPYYLPVPRKGDYRFRVVNCKTNDNQILNEKIDVIEEKSVEIIWKKRYYKELIKRIIKSFAIKRTRIIDTYIKLNNHINTRINGKKKNIFVLFLFFVLISSLSIFIASVLPFGTAKLTKVGNDSISPTSPIDSLKELAIVIDSINPTELGVLSNSVIYYKKDSSYYFINQIGEPLAKGKAFDKFTLTNNIIITELIKTDSTELKDGPYGKVRREIVAKKVKQQSLYGIVSLNGEELVPCKNDMIKHLSVGVHTYKSGSLWGCVSDTSEILKCKYKSIENGGIDNVLLCQDDSNDLFCFYNIRGEQILPNTNEMCFQSASPFSNGVCLVKSFKKNAGYFIDINGKKIWSPVEAGYADCEPFNNKIARVIKYIGGKKKYGLIDNNYNEILPCLYDAIEEYGKNSVEVKTDGRWKVISYNQEVITEIRDYYYSRISTYFIEIHENDNTYSLFLNNKLFQNKLSFVYLYGYGKCAEIKKGNYRYLANCDGKISKPYSDITLYEEGKVFKVRNESGSYGLIDSDFNILVECKYKYLGSYINGILVAKQDSLYGYINKKGDWILSPAYNDAKDLINGELAIVKYENKYGIIKTNKDVVLPFNYDKIVPHPLFSSLYVVCKNNRYGIYDAENKYEIVPCEFENDFQYISNNLYPVLKKGKWGLYTRTGRNTFDIINKDSLTTSSSYSKIQNK